MQEERRKYPRFFCPNDKFCSFRLKGEREFSGNIMNISRDGIAFSSPKALKSDSIIDMSLTYSDIERQIPSKVEVIWSRPSKVINSYGAKFVDIQAEDKADLLDFFYEDWKKRVVRERKISGGK